MSRVKDLLGQRFGRLIVTRRVEDVVNSEGRRYIMWYCECDCGGNKIITTCSLTGGITKSCGCISKETSFRLQKKYNTYDLTGEYGIGYTFKDEPFYFDLEDYDKIKDTCWRYDRNGYILGLVNRKSKLQHRIIMNCPDGMEVDHIYQIHHDNRKSELRWATSSQNSMNTNMQRNNTSGIIGISWSEERQKWLANITCNHKILQRRFTKIEDAIEWRNKNVETLFGEFALKDNPDINKQINNNIIN
jgi:hypothetical protein